MQRAEPALIEAAKSTVRRAAVIAWESAHDTSLYKDRTGALRSATRVADGKDDFSVVLSAGKKYASFVESGTKSHDISPRRAKLLRFKVGGAWVFARKVRHPGTTSRPFMRIASKAGEQALLSLLNKAADAAVLG